MMEVPAPDTSGQGGPMAEGRAVVQVEDLHKRFGELEVAAGVTSR